LTEGEMDNSLILWVAGTSVGGFLFLAGWCWSLREQVSRRVTYESLDKKFEAINEIRDALLGDMKNEGLISRVRRQQDKCIMHGLLKSHIDEPTGALK